LRSAVFPPNRPNPLGPPSLVPGDDVSDVELSVRRRRRLLVTAGATVDDADEAPVGVAE